MKERQAGRSQHPVEKRIAGFPLFLLMARIVQFHHKHPRQIPDITNDKIQMFALNTIEKLLPCRTTDSRFYPDHIGQADLAQNPIRAAYRLLKRPKKFTLGRCVNNAGAF